MASADLTSYQLQLQQVEAALLSDPQNSELLILKRDLEEVIELTKELVAAEEESVRSDNASSRVAEAEKVLKDEYSASDIGSTVRNRRAFHESKPIKHWQVGEECRAIYHQDGQYYDAVIEEITTDGEVSVRFVGHGTTGATTLGSLRVSSTGFSGTTASANKKEHLAKQREQQKKKKAKKAERFKLLEKQREDEKVKWQSFSAKAFGKKGFVKKSIFKTPENPKGRVGVGTCGVSGQKMTSFSSAAKYRRGT